MADPDLTKVLSATFGGLFSMLILILFVLLLFTFLAYLIRKSRESTKTITTHFEKSLSSLITGLKGYSKKSTSYNSYNKLSANYNECSSAERCDRQEDIKEVGYQPYAKKNYFFSVSELRFYELLKEITDNHYYVFPKVRICDIIQTKENGNYSNFNRIKSKHVDFLICTKDPITSKIIIELDDKSHNQPKRQDRDDFVDEIFANAGIPIVHIKVQYEYNKDEIAEKLKRAYKTKYLVKEESATPVTEWSRGCGNLYFLFIIIILGLILK
jgi:very-short-patch-repair endonuclease